MKYRKKPVVIDAIQWQGEPLTVDEAMAAFGRNLPLGSYLNGDRTCVIPTLEGDMRCDVGDWIIKGVMGEFYPCKPDAFVLTYEAVREDGK